MLQSVIDSSKIYYMTIVRIWCNAKWTAATEKVWKHGWPRHQNAYIVTEIPPAGLQTKRKQMQTFVSAIFCKSVQCLLISRCQTLETTFVYWYLHLINKIC